MRAAVSWQFPTYSCSFPSVQRVRTTAMGMLFPLPALRSVPYGPTRGLPEVLRTGCGEGPLPDVLSAAG